jgi:RNA polymerase sigma factor (sigma-70 family)
MSMAEFNDRNFIEAFRRGDTPAVKAVHDKYFDQLFYVAKRIIKDENHALDVIGETFLEMSKVIRQFNDLEHIRKFLFKTIGHRAINKLKKLNTERLNHQELRYLSPRATDFLDQDELMAECLDILYQEIEALPTQARQVIKHVLDKKPTGEIAELMGISQQTVLNHKSSAMKALKIKILSRDVLIAYIFLCFLGRDICNSDRIQHSQVKPTSSQQSH